MVLAWAVSDKLSPLLTCQVLAEAAKRLPKGTEATTDLLVDNGNENFNAQTDAFFGMNDTIHRVLAQVDVTYSNSMIEAFWRSLKHNWLYLHTFDSIATVRKLVAFFVEEHNNVMPHRAFHGQTPAEVYFATGALVPEQLAAAAAVARDKRLADNRAKSCATCTVEIPVATSPPSLRDDKLV